MQQLRCSTLGSAQELLLVHGLLSLAYTCYDQMLTDDRLAEGIAYVSLGLLFEAAFLILTWRGRRWAWLVMAWLTPVAIAYAAAVIAHPQWSDYRDWVTGTALIPGLAVAIVQALIWFRPELRRHVARQL